MTALYISAHFTEREGDQAGTVAEDRRQREQMLALSQVEANSPLLLCWKKGSRMIKDNYKSCAGAGSPGDGEKPRGCRTAGRQGVKSNQKEKYEVKPPEEDFFSNQR